MADVDATKVILKSPALGEVELFGFEIPETLPLGGVQQIAVTEYLGKNKRAVHALGAQPRPLEWSGIFLTDSALARANLIDGMRLRGETLEIIFGEFKAKVIISQFFFDVKHQWRVEYSIILEIVETDLKKDNLQIVESLDHPEDGILALMDKIQDGFLILQRSISVIRAIERGDINAIGGAIANILGIMGTVSNYIPGLNFSQFKAIAVSAVAIATTASALAAKLERIVGPLGLGSPIDEALALSNSASVLAALIGRYNNPVAVRSVGSVSTNVFRVAMEQYGTLDRWEDIAEANNIKRVLTVGPKNIQLPSFKGEVPKGPRNSDVYDINKSNIPLPRGS